MNLFNLYKINQNHQSNVHLPHFFQIIRLARKRGKTYLVCRKTNILS